MASMDQYIVSGCFITISFVNVESMGGCILVKEVDSGCTCLCVLHVFWDV